MADPRDPLLALLDRHASSRLLLSDEAEGLARMQAFVRTREACFERSHLDGHVTGSAWIVDAAEEQVILLHHKKLGLWLQPGGHADGVTDVARVASTEAAEETGIEGLELVSPEIFDVDVHAIPARKGDPAHFHYDVRFAFRAPEGAQPVVSEESHAVAWVPRDRVPQLTTDRSVLRMLDKQARVGLVP